jgi:hypothetical protein
LLKLAQAADRLQWSVRTLKRRLWAHGIGMIGSGRLARLTERDLAVLVEAERQLVPKPSPGVDPLDRIALSIDRMRRSKAIGRALRLQSEHRQAQPIRKKPARASSTDHRLSNSQHLSTAGRLRECSATRARTLSFAINPAPPVRIIIHRYFCRSMAAQVMQRAR